MPYGETKVYSDGSHYIAIPHTTRPYMKRRKIIEEEITVFEDKEKVIQQTGVSEKSADTPIFATEKPNKTKEDKQEKITTKKELFNALYKEYYGGNCKNKEKIVSEMTPYFKSYDDAKWYVESNILRKKRNLICRKMRLMRKAYLHNFNYFVTFTYDGKKHTEQSFRKKLLNTLSHLSSRKGWKYIGVWERSPEKKRLHFHGVFYIPKGTMPGELIEVNDYDTVAHMRQITLQNTYFNARFGRSDFKEIKDSRSIGEAMAYLIKYLEKSGEKIVYSRRLPQFFISDVVDDDVVCRIGIEEKKLLLYDDFKCWDEGVFVGRVSAEVISKMRTSN